MGAWQPTRPRPSMLARSRRGARNALQMIVWLGAVGALFALRAVTPPTPHLPGLVDVRDCTLTAPVGGRVASVAVQLHAMVEADAVVLRFDDHDVRLRIEQAQCELERLRADLARELADIESRARAQVVGQVLAEGLERGRLAAAVEAAQLAALSTRAELEEARVRLQGAAAELQSSSGLVEGGRGADADLSRARSNHDALQKRVDGLAALHEEQRAVVAASAQRLAGFAPPAAGASAPDPAHAPMRWRIKEQEVQLERIALDAQALDVRAPLRGVVASLAVATGEWVHAGHALLTLVDPQPRRILAWATDAARRQLAPAATMRVQRADASVLGATSILSISPTVVRLPARLWRDPQREEWGYEIVLAAIGGELPGERVQLAPSN